MKKKVCADTLTLDEIIDRIDRGEKAFYEYDENLGMYYQKYRGHLVRYVDGKPEAISGNLYLGNLYYFLDEEEDEETPQADESCIRKLCCFWNKEGEEKVIGFLGEINKEHEFPFAIGFGYCGLGFKHCRPLTVEEAKKFIKEN